MTLRTLGGAERRMPIRRDSPLSDLMALRAIFAKESPMTILARVATDAIEHGGVLAKSRVGRGQRTRQGRAVGGAWVNPIG